MSDVKRRIGFILESLENKPLGGLEKTCFALLFGLMALLRLVYVFQYRVDSDEPQHLHVAWAWTKGLVQYRDVFDNHAPLFHMLMSPLVALIGERPYIVILMRLVMVPMFGVSLWVAYLIVRRLSSARIGLWAAVFLGLFPGFFLCSVEFRTDDLWVMTLMLALLVFIAGEFSRLRAFLGGLLLGMAFCVSMKSVAISISLAGTVLLFPVISKDVRNAMFRRKTIALALLILAGALVIPAAICVLFASLGAWKDLVYCTISHNVVPGQAHKWRPLWFYGCLAVPVALLFFAARKASSPPFQNIKRLRMAALFLITGLYGALLGFWPLIQPQTLLSLYPLAIMTLVCIPFAMRSFPDGVSVRELVSTKSVAIIPPGIAILFLASIILFAPPWKNNARQETSLIARVMQLTGDTDYVLDPKGTVVFRNRPTYHVFETFTDRRMGANIIPDDTPESCEKTRTCIVVHEAGSGFPGHTRKFIQKCYLEVERWGDRYILCVPGTILHCQQGDGAAQIQTFKTVIPARYSIVDKHNKFVTGKLDNQPCTGPIELTSGLHTFEPDDFNSSVAVIWSRAVDHGLSPFKVRRS